jgi:2'-hydroxyisoflavone reductase
MKLLVLGGTRFLGRHFVDAALARGHAVTLFTRGRTPVPWGDRVEARSGNRDPRIAPGLAALAGGDWDAAVDTSGYLPRVVNAGLEALGGRVQRYLFVSSLSVYADVSRAGTDENEAVAQLADPATEDVPAHFGALKAACEATVQARLGSRATVVRPGLIVGPHDATDRFGYWVARFCAPHLLGARGEFAVLPAPPSRPLQVVDARDLAAFMLGLLERDVGGVFNACSPQGKWTFADLVAALAAAQRAGAAGEGGAAGADRSAAAGAAIARSPRPLWVDDATLVAHGVDPWTGLPLWIPASDPESGGFMAVDCRRAAEAGLEVRSIESTVTDTAAWLVARDNAGAWLHVLDAEREAAIAKAVAPVDGAPTRPGRAVLLE